MNEQYAYMSHGAFAYPNAYGAIQGPSETEGREPGHAVLSACIWIPTLLIAGALMGLGQPVIALIVLGAITILHSLVQPRIAIYALVATIPLEWMVNVIPRLTAMGKLVGFLALFVSIPALVRAITSAGWDRCAKWILVLISWGAIGCLWSGHIALFLGGYLSVLFVWGIPLLVCLHIKSHSTLRMTLLILAVSCLISSATIVRINDPSRITAKTSVRATTISLLGGAVEGEDQNSVSRYMALGLFACIYLILSSRGTLKRLLLMASIMVMAAAIIILKGRAVYVALPAALMGGVFMLKGAGVQKRLMLTFSIIIMSTVTAFAIVKLGFMGAGIVERFESIFEEGAQAGNRFRFWMVHVDAFIDTGFRGAGFGKINQTLGHVAHNDWVHILGELGVVGIVAFFGFHVALFSRIRNLGNDWDKMFCMVVWLFILIAGLTQNDWYSKNYTLPVAMIMAMVRLNENTEPWSTPALLSPTANLRHAEMLT